MSPQRLCLCFGEWVQLGKKGFFLTHKLSPEVHKEIPCASTDCQHSSQKPQAREKRCPEASVFSLPEMKQHKEFLLQPFTLLRGRLLTLGAEPTISANQRWDFWPRKTQGPTRVHSGVSWPLCPNFTSSPCFSWVT